MSDRGCIECGDAIDPNPRRSAIYCSHRCACRAYARTPRARDKKNAWKRANREKCSTNRLQLREARARYRASHREAILARERASRIVVQGDVIRLNSLPAEWRNVALLVREARQLIKERGLTNG